MVSVQSRLWFDTLFIFQKNCSEAKEGAVRVKFSPDQYQGRFCTSQDQSSPVQSRRPLGFGHVLSDQPATSCLEHCSDVKSKSGLGTGLGLMCISLVFPLLEARSWQEAKSNLVTVTLGKDDRIAWCWTLGPPVRVAKPYALTQRDELVDELV
ncbi:hypothetical protein YC2023_072294 [Brassica napus]